MIISHLRSRRDNLLSLQFRKFEEIYSIFRIEFRESIQPNKLNQIEITRTRRS